MGTDPKAEILAQAAQLEELIDRSTNINSEIECLDRAEPSTYSYRNGSRCR
jgi:hypothetical protein